ncbi:MAG: hypothetical protein GX102_04055 [Porphyromonadaceae bacterium]|nr:hypothetical protein [Porphyromonadaceae bacterium]
MKKLFISLVTVLFGLSLHAQNFKISGKLIEKQDKTPVISAKILLQSSEKTDIKAILSDEYGLFNITDVVPAAYRLQISSIGLDTLNIDLPEVTTDILLGEIEMETSSHLLKSVEVQGKGVINQSDKQLYFVTNEQRKLASNGVNLIQQMSIPKLHFDPVKNAIVAVDNKSVQLRINDVPAETADITAIQPKDIIRVEYIDNPGLRYGTDVGYVLNFVVEKRNSGGSAGVDLNNSVNRIFGRNNLYAKLNSGKSEVSLQYYNNFFNLGGLKRINVETFRFEDGSERVREEIGIPSRLKQIGQNGTLNYNYTDADKRVFNAKIRYYSNVVPNMDFVSRQYWRDNPDNLVDMKDLNKENLQSPSVDLYYLEKLPNDQTLIVDLYYTKRLNSSERAYSEMQNGAYLTDIHSNVKGDRDSYIGEVMYEKNFKTNKLTAGLRHQQSFTTNTYYGDTDVQTNMTQAVSYLYAEFSGKVEKLDYRLGMGVSRSNIVQKNGSDKALTDVFIRPRINLNYKINDLSNLRFRAWMYNETPSLSQLSNVCQAIDSYQRQCGNPDLKASLATYSEISYNYNAKIFDINAEAGYWSRHKPVMEETRREGGQFIRTYDNQKFWGRFNTEFSGSLRPWENYINIRLTAGYYNTLSEGNTYRHTLGSFYHQENIIFNYKKMSLSLMNYKGATYLFGESADDNESIHIIDFTYNADKFSVGASMFSPFTKTYKRNNQNFSEYAPRQHEWYSNQIQGLFMLKFAYNLRWGEAGKASSKRINNEDNDSGILQGGK